MEAGRQAGRHRGRLSCSCPRRAIAAHWWCPDVRRTAGEVNQGRLAADVEARGGTKGGMKGGGGGGDGLVLPWLNQNIAARVVLSVVRGVRPMARPWCVVPPIAIANWICGVVTMRDRETVLIHRTG